VDAVQFSGCESLGEKCQNTAIVGEIDTYLLSTELIESPAESGKGYNVFFGGLTTPEGTFTAQYSACDNVGYFRTSGSTAGSVSPTNETGSTLTEEHMVRRSRERARVLRVEGGAAQTSQQSRPANDLPAATCNDSTPTSPTVITLAKAAVCENGYRTSVKNSSSRSRCSPGRRQRVVARRHARAGTHAPRDSYDGEGRQRANRWKRLYERPSRHVGRRW